MYGIKYTQVVGKGEPHKFCYCMWRDSYKHMRADLTEREYYTTIGPRIGQLIEDPQNITIVAEVDDDELRDEYLGFICATRDTRDLWYLYVKRPYRNSGIGRELLVHAFDVTTGKPWWIRSETSERGWLAAMHARGGRMDIKYESR
jgi:GNAT superfamily N-acetyltransferase